MKRSLVIGLLIQLWAWTSVASAQEECTPPAGPAAARASTLFRRAQTVLDEGNADEAVQLLQEVLQIHESPNVRLVLARALTLNGHAPEAWDSYRRAEEHAALCGDRYAQAGASALQERAGVARQIGLLRVVVAGVNGPVIEVRDGASVPRTVRGGEVVAVHPGLVEVKIEATGFADWSEVVRMDPGSTRELEVQMRPDVPAPEQVAREVVAAEEAPALEIATPSNGLRGAAIGTGALAIATLAMSIVSFVIASGVHSDAEAQCSALACPGSDAFAADLDRGERWNNAGVGLAIATGALAITSIGLGVAAANNPAE